MYEAGVTLTLNDQITAKLERMIPLVNRLVVAFERMDAILGKSGSLNRANSELSQMAKNMSTISSASKGLEKTASRINSIGNAAQKSSSKLTQLGQTLSVRNLARGINKGVGGAVSFLGKTGLAIFGIEQLASFSSGLAQPSLEYARLQNQMKMTGWTERQRTEANRIAEDLRKKYPGTGLNETLRGLIESKAIFSDADIALQKAPLMAAAEQLIRASKEQAPHLQGHVRQSAGAMVKTAEMIGAVSDPKRFDTIIQQMLKASILSGGRVTPEMFQQQMATAGPSRYLWDPGAMMLMLTHLNQEMAVGGIGIGARGRAGVEMKTAAQTLLQGGGGKKFIESMDALGMMDMKGNVKGYELLRTDPIKWAGDLFIPALEKKHPGYRGLEPGAQSQAFNESVKGGPAYTRAFLSELALTGPRETIIRQSAQRDRLPGGDIQQGLAQRDVANRLKAINDSWDSLRIKLGQNTLAINIFGKGLDGILRLMNSLNRMADDLNAFSKRLGSSSNDINRALGAISKVIEGFIKSIYQIIQGIPAAIGTDFKAVTTLFSGANFDKKIEAMNQFNKAFDQQVGNMQRASKTVDHALSVAADRVTGSKRQPPVVQQPPGGGVLSRLRGPATTDHVTINFHAPVYTHSPDELTNHMIKKVDAHQKKQALIAGYTKSAGSGLHQSPFLSPAGK